MSNDKTTHDEEKKKAEKKNAPKETEKVKAMGASAERDMVNSGDSPQPSQP